MSINKIIGGYISMFKPYQKVMKRVMVGAFAAVMMLSTTSVFAATKATTDTKPLSSKDFTLTVGKENFDILTDSFGTLATITDTTPEAFDAAGLRVYAIANDDLAAITTKRVNTLAAQAPVESVLAYSDKVSTARGISVGSSKLDMLAAYPQPDMNLSRYLTSLIGSIETGIDAADYDTEAAYKKSVLQKDTSKAATATTNYLVSGLQTAMQSEDMHVYFFTAEDYLLPTATTDFYAQYKAKGRFSTKDYNVMIVTQKNKVTLIGYISNATLNEVISTLKEEANEVRTVVRDTQDTKDINYSYVDLLVNLVSGDKRVDALAAATETETADSSTTTETTTTEAE